MIELLGKLPLGAGEMSPENVADPSTYMYPPGEPQAYRDVPLLRDMFLQKMYPSSYVMVESVLIFV